MTKDIEWYKEAWNSRKHECQECGLHLPAYSKTYVSHIVSRGAFPALRNHPENFMLYCQKCHFFWEFSGKRKTMKTFEEAMEIADRIKREHYEK